MDIVELHRALDDEELQRQLEALILAALRKQLDTCREVIANAQSDRDQGDCSKDKQDEILEYVADQDDLLRMLGAIASGNGDGTDPYVDCATIQRVLNRRREFYSNPVETAQASTVALIPRAAATAPRRPGRPGKYNWPEFAAEMARRVRETPINNATDLVEHMSQWCLNQWGEQPAASQIWDWVTPTCKAINGLAATDNPTTDLPANTA